jgi:hypothetical protein
MYTMDYFFNYTAHFTEKKRNNIVKKSFYIFML